MSVLITPDARLRRHEFEQPLTIFCNLSLQERTDFAVLGRPVSVTPGTILMREGSMCRKVYVLCSGQVKLSCTSRAGRNISLKIAIAGEVLGLDAALSATRVAMTAEALVPVRAHAIRRDDFLDFLHRHNGAAFNAAQALAEEYRFALSGTRSLALSDATGRIAKFLLDFGSRATPGGPGMRVELTLTHDDIAEFAATTRETVTRTLSRFRKEKIIHTQGTRMHIIQPDKLAELLA